MAVFSIWIVGKRFEELIREKSNYGIKIVKVMNESVFVKFNSEEERLAALRRMVGLRKVWDARVSELMAKHPEMQVAQ